MSQLFANRKDVGKGRNMPVHYGSRKLNIVRCYCVSPYFTALIGDDSIRYLHRLRRRFRRRLVPLTL